MNELKNKKMMKQVTELFKCHFTAKEVAATLGLSYAVVINVYRGLRFAKVKQYDRLTLSEENIIYGKTNDEQRIYG